MRFGLYIAELNFLLKNMFIKSLERGTFHFYTFYFFVLPRSVVVAVWGCFRIFNSLTFKLVKKATTKYKYTILTSFVAG